MIRFIEIGGQIYPYGENRFVFAWYDTVTSRFLSFNYSQTWETWEEFEEDYKKDMKFITDSSNKFNDLKRFKRLFAEKENINDF